MKKAIGLMKDNLGGKTMTEVAALRAKACSYLIDDGYENKKADSTKKCVIKENLKFKDCKNGLEANQLENEINLLEYLYLYLFISIYLSIYLYTYIHIYIYIYIYI